jgi:hypothetical protein
MNEQNYIGRIVRVSFKEGEGRYRFYKWNNKGFNEHGREYNSNRAIADFLCQALKDVPDNKIESEIKLRTLRMFGSQDKGDLDEVVKKTIKKFNLDFLEIDFNYHRGLFYPFIIFKGEYLEGSRNEKDLTKNINLFLGDEFGGEEKNIGGLSFQQSNKYIVSVERDLMNALFVLDYIKYHGCSKF